MIIEKASKHAEAQSERAKRLYQVGNIIEDVGDLYLICKIDDKYCALNLATGVEDFIKWRQLRKLGILMPR